MNGPVRPVDRVRVGRPGRSPYHVGTIELSFEGKANTLAQMVRSNLPAAMQMGMIVVPLFAGYDLRRQRGRIFTYD